MDVICMMRSLAVLEPILEPFWDRIWLQNLDQTDTSKQKSSSKDVLVPKTLQNAAQTPSRRLLDLPERRESLPKSFKMQPKLKKIA